MPFYSLPSLAKVLCTTSGLEKYEVESLTRSAFQVLTKKFYPPRKSRKPKLRYNLGEYMWEAACLASETIDNAIEHIVGVGEKILVRKPVNLGRHIELFDPTYYSRLKKFVQFGEDLSCHRCSIKVGRRGDRGHVCRKPKNLIRRLVTETANAKGKDWMGRKATTVHVGQRRIERAHGDAHFGNFLIDASVPEKPVVFLIDTKHVNIQKKIFPLLFKDVNNDPLYDFAKLMLSCAVGYDLAYMEGVRPRSLGRRRTGNLWAVSLEFKGREQLQKLGDVGGVTDAQIVRLAARVSEDAVQNYRYANKVIRELTAAWLQDELRPNVRSVAAAQVTMWLFAIRHAFSIAQHLFPKYPERSFAMLVLAMRFLETGFDAAMAVIASCGRDPSAVAQLGGCFELLACGHA